MKSVIKHWLTFNMKIVVLMVVAVAVVTLYDFFFNIQWIQLLVERNITIVPAVIGLMLQSNYYNLFFKRRVLKIVTPMSLIFKRMASNNNFIIYNNILYKMCFKISTKGAQNQKSRIMYILQFEMLSKS